MMKTLLKILFVVLLSLSPLLKIHAQVPVADVIKNALIKIIKAIDLQVQRQQNKVIWLQNAQKTIENAMSLSRLSEITDWVEKQKTLYRDYYEELSKVKSYIVYYQRVRDISQKQVSLLQQYHRSWNLFKQDKHFTPVELAYMSKIYAGILNESAKNIDQLFLVIHSFQTRMSDAKRLEIINASAQKIEGNYFDLIEFNQQNVMLSLNRAKAYNDVEVMRKYYGVQ